jgi:hypothetical protein
MTPVEKAIRHAELVLPGSRALEGNIDPRWQAIIAVGEYVASDPEPVWRFVCRWAEHEDDDLQTALGTCLLEHLLEHHFAAYFPRVERACEQSEQFARVFATCWPFGQAEDGENSARFNGLKKRLCDAGEQ